MLLQHEGVCLRLLEPIEACSWTRSCHQKDCAKQSGSQKGAEKTIPARSARKLWDWAQARSFRSSRRLALFGRECASTSHHHHPIFCHHSCSQEYYGCHRALMYGSGTGPLNLRGCAPCSVYVCSFASYHASQVAPRAHATCTHQSSA